MRLDGFGPGSGATRGKPNPLKRRATTPGSLLAEAVQTGANPGNLRQFLYVPSDLPPGAPLVVALHGCGQSAAGYDLGAGWSQLADRHGFALLAPEQKAVNNPGTCFNWFNPGDVTRGEGEVASIAAMIVQLVEQQGLDAKRVFITGLSAGGAMTAAMLATYPELFAGGAIIAGLPYGAAANVREALDAMRSAPLKTPQQWGDMVRGATAHDGPWPAVSIWHGAIDTTVNINNAQASAAQWADLHGLSLLNARQDTVGGAVRLRWGDRLEVYTLPLLGHGTPIDSGDVGQAGPFMLEAGISSGQRIAEFWGLVAKPAARQKPVRAAPQPSAPEPAIGPVIEPVLEEAPVMVEIVPESVRAMEPQTLLQRAMKLLRGA